MVVALVSSGLVSRNRLALSRLIRSDIWTFVGFGFLTASLAEMASMAPTAGGQVS